MSDMQIKATERTPEFTLNSTTGELIFSGESYPENAISFYKPILEKVEALCQSKTDLLIRFELIYMNSSTLGMFRNMMNMMNTYDQQGNTISVVWQFFHDDDDMREIVEDFQELFSSIQFRFQPIAD